MKKLNDRDKIKSDFINNDELPKDWKFSSIENLSTSIQYGYTASALQNFEGPRLLRITDIQNDTVNWDTVPSCEITKENFLKFELKPGDIVFARTGATTGKSYLIQSCPKAVFASYLIRIRPNNSVDPHFLILFFQTMDYWRMISENVAGITQPNCNASKLKNLTVPVPPLSEQHRIIARVEALFSQINAARDRLNRVPLIMKRFRQAVLAAACSGRLTEGWREENPAIEPAEKYLCHLNNEQKIKIKQKNEGIDVDSEYELPINWIYVCLDNILEKNRAIRYGVLKPGIDDPNGIRLIKSGQVRDGFMDLTEIYRITRDLDQQYSRTRLQGGELLLNLVGASIGRSAIAPNELRGANVSRAIAVIPILNSHSKYVQLSLQGPIGQKLIQSKTGGTAQPVLNLEEVRKLLIPLPPLSELDEIIRRVETLFTLADKIEQEVAEAMKRTEALTQAVLAKAFRGELVEREVESNEVHPT